MWAATGQSGAGPPNPKTIGQREDIGMRPYGKTLVLLAAALVMLGMLAAPALASDDVVRLGVISPASGNYADLGAAERRGITMAVEEINAAGGVLGKQVKMIVEDTETNPAAGARKAQKLMERDKVHFMLGAVSSSVAIAISEVAQRNNTIYLNTNTNSSECTGKHCHRTNFRVGPNNHMLVHSAAPYMAKKFGKNWFFITHDYSWGRSGTKTFRQILKQVGGKELGEALIPMNTRDFSSYLIKIRNLSPKPDMIMCTIGGVDRSAMFEQIRQFGMDKDYRWGFSLMDYGDCFAVGADKAIGIFAAEWYHTIDAPGVKEFVAKYKKRWPDAQFKVPENNCYQGYIGARALLRAAMRAKSLETTPVIKALEGWTIKDNMKPNPTYIRPWDHQFVQDVVIARIKTKEELAKGDQEDFYHIIDIVDGKNVVRTREQNPCKLEPYK
jgi:branched-chain amino acid transport system substrate-binding protein